MRLHFEARVATGDDQLDTGVRAVTSAELGGGLVVFAATGAGGGLSAYRLTAEGALRPHDSARFSPDLPGAPSRDIAVASWNDAPALIVGAGDGQLVARGLADDGSLGALLPPVDLGPGPETVQRLDYRPEPEGGGLLSLAEGAAGVTLYRLSAEGVASPLVQLQDEAVATRLGDGPAGTFVAALGDAAVHGALLPAGGGVAAFDGLGADDGLPVDAPTAIETVAAHGAQFMIVAAAGTHSLSVLEIGADGTTRIRDHLIDTRMTRFADPQDLAVAAIDGQVFVVAGGGDDGLSLFTLLPGGRLVHLDSLVSTTGASLGGVVRLDARGAQDKLHVFASTQGEPGLAHLAMTAGNMGQVLQGADTLEGGPGRDLLVAEGADGVLRGGEGADILFAGPSGGHLTGGQGADLFVLRAGGGQVRITDFEIGTDRLDLSDFAMLRGPGQLDISATDSGARIVFRDEDLRIDSHDGEPIDAEALFGAAFAWPDRMGMVLDTQSADPEPNPAPAPPPQPSAGPGPDGLLRIASDDPDPWLAGARITFTPAEGGPVTAVVDADGRVDLSEAGGETGHVEILRGYRTSDPQIGVEDALNVLRLAVGLEPSFGPATPRDLVAADVDRDGTITVNDALEVLRAAVGLETANPPEWLFLDPQADPGDGIAAAESVPLSIPEADPWEVSVLAVLTGNLDGTA